MAFVIGVEAKAAQLAIHTAYMPDFCARNVPLVDIGMVAVLSMVIKGTLAN